MSLSLLSRYAFFAVCVIFTLASLPFLESDIDALPFSRAQRSLVYSRAKNESADKPFGTLIDVYQSGFEFIGHSMRPAPLSDPSGFRVTVGGPQCTQPYSASVFNISALSFGSLRAHAN